MHARGDVSSTLFHVNDWKRLSYDITIHAHTSTPVQSARLIYDAVIAITQSQSATAGETLFRINTHPFPAAGDG